MERGMLTVRQKRWPTVSVWPAAALLLVSAGDLFDGPGHAILGTAAMVPLMASALVSWRLTSVYAAAALAVVALVGIYDQGYSGGNLASQVERLVATAFSGVAALAVVTRRMRNERRLENMTSLAERLQRSMLPPPPPMVAGLRIAASYQSATEEARVGGDFYDVAETPWGVRVVIGDVQGKGLDAVRLASIVLSLFRDRAVCQPELPLFVTELDASIERQTGEEGFVTACIAEFPGTGGTMRLVLAGHPPPLVISGHGAASVGHATAGRPLGLGLGRPPVTAVEVRLGRGDRILFYTDGTSEARSADGEFFGSPRVSVGVLHDVQVRPVGSSTVIPPQQR